MSRTKLLLAFALVLCLATRIWFLIALPQSWEDAYITYRYAEHWAHGFGPVYNIGEKAWGFTSALWTSVLALVSLVGLPIESFARGTLVVCDLVALLLGWRLLARHSLLAACGFGFFFALWPRFAQMPASGLESSLVLALLLAAATFARTKAGGLLHGLLALSRPEGAAMSLVLAKRLSWPQRAVWLVVASLQAGFMFWFGKLAPSSVSSKATVYGVQTLKGLYWLEWLVPGLPTQTADGDALAPVAILLLAGVIAAVLRWRKNGATGDDEPVAFLFACGLLTLFGYLVLGVPPFFWYAPVPMTAILLASFLGLGTSGALRWTLAPMLVFLVVSWPPVASRAARLQTHDADVFTSVGRTLRQDAAGRDASVMLEPIGIIGWTSGLRVVDEVGLVTPWIAEERAKGDGWYARVMARWKPDYLVFRKDWLAGGVDWAGIGSPFVSQAQRDSSLANYDVVRWRAGGAAPSGSGRMLILKRRP